ncbi:dihydrofolate reductase [Salirhabdus salicampi]|uniref:dihydrofolate reductase n=1 Tax=Salirhabdus salicampi TaxID=476102 RepID=UPI0020C428B4|nr:dihydrofolate reductase [Salirhabdus salicampi]MCP8616089.1 dihydrofolate reductase [Salirhabdus salicampi]
MISLIVAVDDENGIGKDGQLPWHLPNDLKYFKEKTVNHPIVMGRKTYESIGRPLPKRENIILTRNKDFKAEGCKVIHNWEAVHQLSEQHPEEEVFVIGGYHLFKDAIRFADKLYLTKIEGNFQADTFFPDVDLSQWKLISKEKGTKDEKNPYNYYFCEYVKS